jgi:hypothetical protein
MVTAVIVSVIMLIVFMLSVFVLSVFVLSVFVLSVFVLNIFMLSVVVLPKPHKIRPCISSIPQPGNTKGGSITVPLTSCLTDLD